MFPFTIGFGGRSDSIRDDSHPGEPAPRSPVATAARRLPRKVLAARASTIRIVVTPHTTPPKRQLKQPRIAEIVAEGLRQRILTGELEDGAMLPKQDELLAEFGVSPPSIREALRILETEGLITVQRGNVGGAIVHRPQASKAAYMLGLVLQSRGVNLGDLVDAMRKLEPVCAAECALRADRRQTVLPRLRAVLDKGLEMIDDADAFIGLARQFHIELVANCGNETMGLVVGALEALWSAQVDVLARDVARHGSFSDRSVRQSLADEHERIYRLIAEGDARGVEQATRDHYSGGSQHGERQYNFGYDAPVRASALGT
jgi:DNA-binding FadR family transcriptional regulator